MKKILVNNSGGVDSTTLVAKAVKKYGKENIATVTFFYGQKHQKEIECAKNIAKYYGIKNYLLDISNVLKESKCSLMASSNEEVIKMSYADQIKTFGEGKVSTYVPFRNGLILSSCAALAQSLWEKEECEIWYGAHADDAAGQAYADCSLTFVKAMNKAINIGTYGLVKVVAPFVKKNKAAIVKEGLRLEVPYHLTWSCYNGGEKACGKCGTCIDRLEAFRQNNAIDPIEYEEKGNEI